MPLSLLVIFYIHCSSCIVCRWLFPCINHHFVHSFNHHFVHSFTTYYYHICPVMTHYAIRMIDIRPGAGVTMMRLCGRCKSNVSRHVVASSGEPPPAPRGDSLASIVYFSVMDFWKNGVFCEWHIPPPPFSHKHIHTCSTVILALCVGEGVAWCVGVLLNYWVYCNDTG